MTARPPLAVFGAKPRFGEPLPVGQLYWPEWERYEKAVRDIFSRRYYTSQRAAGPLVLQLQRRLQEFLAVKHAILIGNSAVGLMIAAHTLGLKGKVIVPSVALIDTVRSLVWSNCQPVYCDIDSESPQMSLESVRRLLNSDGIKGILGVHFWGSAAPVHEFEALSQEYDVPLYYDAAHAFGCKVNGRAIGTFGRAEVFSFHESNILNTGGGGCITTNEDELAAKFRAARGDHVPDAGMAMQSATTRMSEIQAAIGLMMLDDFERNCRNNEEQHRAYQKRLSAIIGIKILKPSGVGSSNFQNLVGVVDQLRFGLSRDELLAVLRAENVLATREFHPGNHRLRQFTTTNPILSSELPNTELALQRTFQLPIGARVGAGDIEQICDIIREAHIHSELIRATGICLRKP